MPEQEPNNVHPDAAAREAAWQLDRQVEERPLPAAHKSHYSGEGDQFVDLLYAESGNKARAAGVLGMTRPEWEAKRKQLGRDPNIRDV